MKMNKFKNKKIPGNETPCHSFSGGDHLRSTSGIICGSRSFGVQFGDHLRSGIICGAVQTSNNSRQNRRPVDRLVWLSRLSRSLHNNSYSRYKTGTSLLRLIRGIFSNEISNVNDINLRMSLEFKLVPFL